MLRIADVSRMKASEGAMPMTRGRMRTSQRNKLRTDTLCSYRLSHETARNSRKKRHVHAIDTGVGSEEKHRQPNTHESRDATDAMNTQAPWTSCMDKNETARRELLPS